MGRGHLRRIEGKENMIKILGINICFSEKRRRRRKKNS